jgi:hypothetical protein
MGEAGRRQSGQSKPDEVTSMPMYDFYRSKTEPGERMATDSSVGLPAHVDPNDWELMAVSTTSPELFVHDLDEDIAEWGFCYFKLVDPPPPE